MADISEQLSKLKETEELIKKQQDIIKESSVDVIVAFVDMVGSTALKTKYSDCPEKWISVIENFYKEITDITKANNGSIVKFIGDEALVVFEGKEKEMSAYSFLLQVKNYTKSPEEYKKLKISIDCGKVYKYDNDLLGTVVDRCARIAKYCEENSILTSKECFERIINDRDELVFKSFEKVFLKGIGDVEIWGNGLDSLRKPINVKMVFHMINHILRDKYIEIMSEEMQLRDLTSTLKDIMNILYSMINNTLGINITSDEPKVCVCIKGIMKTRDKKNAEDWETYTLARDSFNPEREKVDREISKKRRQPSIRENTDFSRILTGEIDFFESKDLLSERYNNSNTNYRDFYEAALVLPIRATDTIHGFLCIDTKDKSLFHRSEYEDIKEILKGVADILFVLMNLYEKKDNEHYVSEKHSEPEIKRQSIFAIFKRRKAP